MEHIIEDDWHGVGILKDGTACGGTMLWHIPAEQTAVLPYFAIDKRMQGQGLGKVLYTAAEDLALSIGAKHLETRLFMPEQSGSQGFLVKEGFENFRDEEWTLEVSFDLLREYLSDEDASRELRKACKKYRKNILPLKDLTRAQKNKLDASGMDESLSFAAVEGGTVRSCLLVTRTASGIPMIMELRQEQRYAPLSLAVIGTCLASIAKDLAKKKGGCLYIRASLDRERALLMRLSGDYFSRATLRYTCHAAKTIAAEDEEEEQKPSVFVREEDFLRVRSQAVADTLAELDYDVSFLPDGGGLLSVEKPGTFLPPLMLFYSWDGDEARMAYRLVASCEMPGAGESLLPSTLLRQSCAMVNFSETDGRVIARAALPEYGGISSEDTLKLFIEEFWQEILPFVAGGTEGEEEGDQDLES